MEEIFVQAPPQDIFVLPNNLVTFCGALMLPNNFVSKAQKAMLRTEVSTGGGHALRQLN